MFGSAKELTPRASLQYPLGHPPARMALHSVRAEDRRVVEFRRSTGPDATPTITVVDRGNGRELAHEYVAHSPTGLEFGYTGAGPADTALNILSLVVSPREAYRLHQSFMRYVAAIPRDGGTLTMRGVRDWIAGEYEGELADAERMAEEKEMREILDTLDSEIAEAEAVEAEARR